MVSKSLETVKIDELLLQARIEEKDLKTSLSRVQGRIKSLLETRALITGEEYDDSKEKTIPDLLEEILRERGAQHVSALTEILKTNYPQMHSVGTQTIAGALIRYANKGKRFQRVGKNTFDVLDENKEKNM